MSSIINKLDKNKIPKHIAMIMDGNGRWAKEQGKNRIFGHQQGVETVRKMVEVCPRIGVEYLTLYAFSTENWSRPKFEVNALMELLVNSLRKEIKKLHENNVRIHAIGCIDDLPKKAQKKLAESAELTKNNTGLNLILALSYSAQWDIVNATKLIAGQVKSGILDIEDVTKERFSSYLSTRNFPNPELLIRTSGERRISNYLLWELAYAEFYFTNTHWPAFTEESLYEAIFDYQNRERRFGKTSEQITQ
ncbi:MAG: isoprenyl transferase [Bacteroidetes bacterium]|nr:isoprenyl transferase [Bacteroidota bacterium]